MKVAVYTRVSSDEQAKKGRESLPGQRESQCAIAQRNGWTVHKVYVADGYSGTLLEQNPALQELLKDAEQRCFNAVLVRDLDRLSRDEYVQACILREFVRWGIVIYEDGKLYDPDDDNDRLQLGIKGVISADERRRIKRRLRRGRIAASKAGKPICMGRSPYAYHYDKNTKTVDVDEREASIVRRIFDLYLEGDSMRAIADLLNDEETPSPCADGVGRYEERYGVCPSKGRWTLKGELPDGTPIWARDRWQPIGGWGVCTVGRLLRNPVYTGKHTIEWKEKGGVDVVVIPVPAIISEELFEQAQHVRKGKKRHRNPRTHFYLFGGMVRCGGCVNPSNGEHPVCAGSATNRDGRTWRYYRCNHTRVSLKEERPPCISMVNATKLERKAWAKLCKALPQSEWLQARLDALLSADTTDDVETAMSAEHVKRQLSEKEREKERVIELARRGVLNFDETERELAKVRTETDALQRRLADLSQRTEREQEGERLRERLAAFSARIKDVLPHLTDAEQREMLKELGVNVIVHDKRNATLRGIIPLKTGVEGCLSGVSIH